MAQIDKPNLHFNTITYTGNGSNPRTLTGVGFQPDWTWLKNRTNANGHTLADSIRGANKTISSDGTAAEITDKADGHLDAFTSDGFTVGAGSSGDDRVNDGSHTYVAWNWKANGAGSANTTGSINSTVSVNTTAGFSIVSYTGNSTSGATVGHGLGVAPKMIIIKARDRADSWVTGNDNIGWTKYLYLNTTAAQATSTARFNDTAPSSSVFTLGNATDCNYTDNFIAYCFAEKKGFSKFGKYTGNGNADGTFVYTGFRPAFFLLKRYDAVEGWYMMDNKRNTFNLTSRQLFPASNSVENNMTASNQVNGDILSNGFKIRATDTAINASGGNYIYMAFAENPIVGSNDTPATAR